MPSGAKQNKPPNRRNATENGKEISMTEAINTMALEIAGIAPLHSFWLYGSVVLDDFRLGWSDIDLLVLTVSPLTDGQAHRLLTLRQPS